MAKNMARLNENNIVVNLEWYSDEKLETEELVNIDDYPVGIGDIYENGIFYRDGEKLLTQLEAAQVLINDYATIIAELDAMVLDYQYNILLEDLEQ